MQEAYCTHISFACIALLHEYEDAGRRIIDVSRDLGHVLLGHGITMVAKRTLISNLAYKYISAYAGVCHKK